jgi:hypothetical protein
MMDHSIGQGLVFVLGVTLCFGGCGGSQSAVQNPDGQGSLDWAAGAPSVTPAYSKEEQARLGLCPMISRAVFLAAESKAEGVPLDDAVRELSQPAPELVDVEDEQNDDMLAQFVRATYDQEPGEVASHMVENHATCARELASLTNDRATRVTFCLGRLFVVTASQRWTDVPAAELAARLQTVPGYGEAYVQAGSSPGGKSPTLANFRACMD